MHDQGDAGINSNRGTRRRGLKLEWLSEHTRAMAYPETTELVPVDPLLTTQEVVSILPETVSTTMPSTVAATLQTSQLSNQQLQPALQPIAQAAATQDRVEVTASPAACTQEFFAATQVLIAHDLPARLHDAGSPASIMQHHCNTDRVTEQRQQQQAQKAHQQLYVGLKEQHLPIGQEQAAQQQSDNLLQQPQPQQQAKAATVRVTAQQGPQHHTQQLLLHLSLTPQGQTQNVANQQQPQHEQQQQQPQQDHGAVPAAATAHQQHEAAQVAEHPAVAGAAAQIAASPPQPASNMASPAATPFGIIPGVTQQASAAAEAAAGHGNQAGDEEDGPAGHAGVSAVVDETPQQTPQQESPPSSFISPLTDRSPQTLASKQRQQPNTSFFASTISITECGGSSSNTGSHKLNRSNSCGRSRAPVGSAGSVQAGDSAAAPAVAAFVPKGGNTLLNKSLCVDNRVELAGTAPARSGGTAADGLYCSQRQLASVAAAAAAGSDSYVAGKPGNQQANACQAANGTSAAYGAGSADGPAAAAAGATAGAAAVNGKPASTGQQGSCGRKSANAGGSPADAGQQTVIVAAGPVADVDSGRVHVRTPGAAASAAVVDNTAVCAADAVQGKVVVVTGVMTPAAAVSEPCAAADAAANAGDFVDNAACGPAVVPAPPNSQGNAADIMPVSTGPTAAMVAASAGQSSDEAATDGSHETPGCTKQQQPQQQIDAMQGTAAANTAAAASGGAGCSNSSIALLAGHINKASPQQQYFKLTGTRASSGSEGDGGAFTGGSPSCSMLSSIMSSMDNKALMLQQELNKIHNGLLTGDFGLGLKSIVITTMLQVITKAQGTKLRNNLGTQETQAACACEHQLMACLLEGSWCLADGEGPIGGVGLCVPQQELEVLDEEVQAYLKPTAVKPTKQQQSATAAAAAAVVFGQAKATEAPIADYDVQDGTAMAPQQIQDSFGLAVADPTPAGQVAITAAARPAPEASAQPQLAPNTAATTAAGAKAAVVQATLVAGDACIPSSCPDSADEAGAAFAGIAAGPAIATAAAAAVVATTAVPAMGLAVAAAKQGAGAATAPAAVPAAVTVPGNGCQEAKVAELGVEDVTGSVPAAMLFDSPVNVGVILPITGSGRVLGGDCSTTKPRSAAKLSGGQLQQDQLRQLHEGQQQQEEQQQQHGRQEQQQEQQQDGRQQQQQQQQPIDLAAAAAITADVKAGRLASEPSNLELSMLGMLSSPLQPPLKQQAKQQAEQQQPQQQQQHKQQLQQQNHSQTGHVAKTANAASAAAAAAGDCMDDTVLDCEAAANGEDEGLLRLHLDTQAYEPQHIVEPYATARAPDAPEACGADGSVSRAASVAGLGGTCDAAGLSLYEGTTVDTTQDTDQMQGSNEQGQQAAMHPGDANACITAGVTTITPPTAAVALCMPAAVTRAAAVVPVLDKDGSDKQKLQQQDAPARLLFTGLVGHAGGSSPTHNTPELFLSVSANVGGVAAAAAAAGAIPPDVQANLKTAVAACDRTAKAGAAGSNSRVTSKDGSACTDVAAVVAGAAHKEHSNNEVTPKAAAAHAWAAGQPELGAPYEGCTTLGSGRRGGTGSSSAAVGSRLQPTQASLAGASQLHFTQDPELLPGAARRPFVGAGRTAAVAAAAASRLAVADGEGQAAFCNAVKMPPLTRAQPVVASNQQQQLGLSNANLARKQSGNQQEQQQQAGQQQPAVATGKQIGCQRSNNCSPLFADAVGAACPGTVCTQSHTPAAALSSIAKSPQAIHSGKTSHATAAGTHGTPGVARFTPGSGGGGSSGDRRQGDNSYSARQSRSKAGRRALHARLDAVETAKQAVSAAEVARGLAREQQRQQQQQSFKKRRAATGGSTDTAAAVGRKQLKAAAAAATAAPNFGAAIVVGGVVSPKQQRTQVQQQEHGQAVGCGSVNNSQLSAGDKDGMPAWMAAAALPAGRAVFRQLQPQPATPAASKAVDKDGLLASTAANHQDWRPPPLGSGGELELGVGAAWDAAGQWASVMGHDGYDSSQVSAELCDNIQQQHQHQPKEQLSHGAAADGAIGGGSFGAGGNAGNAGNAGSGSQQILVGQGRVRRQRQQQVIADSDSETDGDLIDDGVDIAVAQKQQHSKRSQLQLHRLQRCSPQQQQQQRQQCLVGPDMQSHGSAPAAKRRRCEQHEEKHHRQQQQEGQAEVVWRTKRSAQVTGAAATGQRADNQAAAKVHRSKHECTRAHITEAAAVAVAAGMSINEQPGCSRPQRTRRPPARYVSTSPGDSEDNDKAADSNSGQRLTRQQQQQQQQQHSSRPFSSKRSCRSTTGASDGDDLSQRIQDSDSRGDRHKSTHETNSGSQVGSEVDRNDSKSDTEQPSPSASSDHHVDDSSSSNGEEQDCDLVGSRHPIACDASLTIAVGAAAVQAAGASGAINAYQYPDSDEVSLAYLAAAGAAQLKGNGSSQAVSQQVCSNAPVQRQQQIGCHQHGHQQQQDYGHEGEGTEGDASHPGLRLILTTEDDSSQDGEVAVADRGGGGCSTAAHGVVGFRNQQRAAEAAVDGTEGIGSLSFQCASLKLPQLVPVECTPQLLLQEQAVTVGQQQQRMPQQQKVQQWHKQQQAASKQRHSKHQQLRHLDTGKGQKHSDGAAATAAEGAAAAVCHKESRKRKRVSREVAALSNWLWAKPAAAAAKTNVKSPPAAGPVRQQDPASSPRVDRKPTVAAQKAHGKGSPSKRLGKMSTSPTKSPQSAAAAASGLGVLAEAARRSPLRHHMNGSATAKSPGTGLSSGCGGDGAGKVHHNPQRLSPCAIWRAEIAAMVTSLHHRVQASKQAAARVGGTWSPSPRSRTPVTRAQAAANGGAAAQGVGRQHAQQHSPHAQQHLQQQRSQQGSGFGGSNGGGNGSGRGRGRGRGRVSPAVPQLAGVKLGCSKCRYSTGGCRECRTKASQQVDAKQQPEQQQQPQQERQPKQQQRRREQQHVEPSNGLEQALNYNTAAEGAGNSAAAVRPAQKAHGARTATAAAAACPGAGPLQGMRLLLTGFPNTAERQQVTKLIKLLGATLLNDAPPAAATHDSASIDARQANTTAAATASSAGVDGLIADMERNTTKYLYAAAAGVPVYSVAWLQACAAAGQFVNPDSTADPSQYQLRPADEQLMVRPAARLLAGYRVLLHGEAKWRAVFAAVVVHAGALVLDQLEAAAPAGGGHNTGATGSSVAEAAVDLVIVNRMTSAAAAAAGNLTGSAGASASQQQLDALHRAARRLHVPIIEAERVVAAILKGCCLHNLQQVLSEGQQQQQLDNIMFSQELAGPDLSEQQQQRQHNDLQQQRQPQQQEQQLLHQQQQQQQHQAHDGSRNCRSAQLTPPADQNTHQGSTAKQAEYVTSSVPASKRSRTGVILPAQLQPQQHQQLPAQQQQCGQVLSPSGITNQACGLDSISLQWLPPGHAAGAGAAAAAAAASPKPAGFRTYYTGFVLQLSSLGCEHVVQRHVTCGDFVLLAPLPGEAEARVVQLLAMWQEVPSDGQVRMLGRGRRFYRPAETIFPMPDGHLFCSDHMEERVTLAGVLEKCNVIFGAAAAAASMAAAAASGDAHGAKVQPPRAQFTCWFHYDHVKSTLRAVTASDSAVQGC